MKARAIKTSPHFDGMFDVGDVVEMINIPYEKDTLLVWGKAVFIINDETVGSVKYDGGEFPDATEDTFQLLPPYGKYNRKEVESGKWVVVNEPTIAPKGSFKELHFKLPDGRVYNTNIIYNCTGKHFPHFFKRIQNT